MGARRAVHAGADDTNIKMTGLKRGKITHGGMDLKFGAQTAPAFLMEINGMCADSILQASNVKLSFAAAGCGRVVNAAGQLQAWLWFCLIFAIRLWGWSRAVIF